VLLEIQKENPDIPTIQELYELDSVSDAYLRSQYTILGSESLARSVIDQLRLDTLERSLMLSRVVVVGPGVKKKCTSVAKCLPLARPARIGKSISESCPPL